MAETAPQRDPAAIIAETLSQSTELYVHEDWEMVEDAAEALGFIDNCPRRDSEEEIFTDHSYQAGCVRHAATLLELYVAERLNQLNQNLDIG